MIYMEFENDRLNDKAECLIVNKQLSHSTSPSKKLKQS